VPHRALLPGRRRRLPGVPEGRLGAPCTTTTCPLSIDGRAVGGVCLSTFPGGYCTLTGCDVSNGAAACGSFAACFAGGGSTFCLRRCTFDPERPQPQACRDLAGEVAAGESSRYVCVKDPLDRSLTAGLCIPDCTRVTGFCTGATTCDATLRTCVPADCVTNPSACGAGTTCDAGLRRCVPRDCRSVAGACEALGRSCDQVSGQCFRCRDLGPGVCTLARACVFSTGACRPRCNPNPCPADATCRGNVCSQ